MCAQPVQAPEDGLDDVFHSLVRVLGEVKPSLDAAAIHRDSSLTADLGLDSLDLAELASRLGDDFKSLDLSVWLAEAMRPGGDTVGSLVNLLSSLDGAR
jgi:acyl carrier protein